VNKNKLFYLQSLGCSKNTVDSQSMAQILHNNGYQHTDQPENAQVLIVNTCGFIGPAKEESMNALQELASNKNSDQILIAAGCLSQRYGSAITKEISGIDGIIGTRRWMDIVDITDKMRKRKSNKTLYHLPDVPHVGKDEKGALRVAIQGSSAYLKIADGCRRPCAFCAIPLIKGSHISRPIDQIIEEAQHLQSIGTQEIILISQDTTDYGHDIGIKNGLAMLLKKLVRAVPEVPWIRIMYAYPGYVTNELIETISTYPQILPYLDMPLQHGNKSMLRKMKRPANLNWVYDTVNQMREKIPNLAIRTTFIVGYPGETEDEFQDLLNFVEDLQFDRLGAFQFSYESQTTSAPLGDPVSKKTKKDRFERLMHLQQNISLNNNQRFIGKNLDVLIEGYDNGISIGRSYRDAPEIDGTVIIEGNLPIGQISNIQITGAMTYDLSGIPSTTQNINLI